MFNEHCQNLAFNTIGVIDRIERWQICESTQKYLNTTKNAFLLLS